MKANKYSQTFFLLVAIPVVLINGVPETNALQKQASRFPRPRKAVSVNQSSRPMVSPMQPFQKELQPVEKIQDAESVKVAVRENVSPMADNKFLQTPILTSLDRRVVWSTATGCLAVLALYSLLRTGRLMAIARHVNWWIQQAFFTYQNSLVNNPLITKVGTGAALAIVGDALAQSTTGGGGPYDKRRAASFAAFDSCYRVFQHNMFPFVIAICQGNILRNVLPWVIPSVSAAVERTLLYQLVVVPTIYYPVFFAFTGSIQGLSFKESLDRARSQFFRCWRRNLMFWIPTQYVLFGLIDEKWQIPFACLMGVIWSTILSLTAGKTAKASTKA